MNHVHSLVFIFGFQQLPLFEFTVVQLLLLCCSPFLLDIQFSHPLTCICAWLYLYVYLSLFSWSDVPWRPWGSSFSCNQFLIVQILPPFSVSAFVSYFFSVFSPAIHEFPRDYFTPKQRTEGAVGLHVLCVSVQQIFTCTLEGFRVKVVVHPKL